MGAVWLGSGGTCGGGAIGAARDLGWVFLLRRGQMGRGRRRGGQEDKRATRDRAGPGPGGRTGQGKRKPRIGLTDDVRTVWMELLLLLGSSLGS